MKRVISSVLVVMLILSSGAILAQAEKQNKLFVYNSTYDLLKGDIWEYITLSEIKIDLNSYPKDYIIIGIGTTNQHYRVGELIVAGTVGDYKFLWADPNYPHKLKSLDKAEFPYLQIAVCAPGKVLKLPLREVVDLHKYLADRLEGMKIKLAAIKIVGDFSRVDYTIAYNLPKSGLDLSGGHVGDEYFRSFSEDQVGEWMMRGTYSQAQELQLINSTPGKPLHIHGYNHQKMQGGHIGYAEVKRATAMIYVIDEYELFESDLSIEGVEIEEGMITVQAVNRGWMMVKNAVIEVNLADGKVLSTALANMRPFSEVEVKFEVSEGVPEVVLVRIDPRNDILELREDNNVFVVH